MSLAERLTRLGQLLVVMSGSPVPTHLFQTLADEAGGALPNDYVAVCLADGEQGGYLVHSLAALPDRSTLGPRVFGPDEGVPGRAMRTGQTCVVEDLGRAEHGIAALEGALARAGLGSALVVPVRRGLEMLGALLFARRAPGGFTPDDVHIAALIASGLSAALPAEKLGIYMGLFTIFIVLPQLIVSSVMGAVVGRFFPHDLVWAMAIAAGVMALAAFAMVRVPRDA